MLPTTRGVRLFQMDKSTQTDSVAPTQEVAPTPDAAAASGEASAAAAEAATNGSPTASPEEEEVVVVGDTDPIPEGAILLASPKGGILKGLTFYCVKASSGPPTAHPLQRGKSGILTPPPDPAGSSGGPAPKRAKRVSSDYFNWD